MRFIVDGIFASMTPEALIHGFLKAAEDAKIPALVVYAPVFGEPNLRVASNRGESTKGVLAWLANVDVNAAVEIGKAQHANGAAGEQAVIAEDRPCQLCGSAESWDALEEAAQARHLALAEVAIAAIRRNWRDLAQPRPIVQSA